MLEDQNDSMKRLKTNLENKVRESSNASLEISKKEELWLEKLDVSRQAFEELQLEVFLTLLN